MLLLTTLLLLGAVLQQSLGKTQYKVAVSTPSEKQQKEIIDKHNDIRRGVKPTASNMLKMSWSDKASKSAKKWAKKCHARISPSEERTVDGTLCGGNIMQSNYVSSWSDVIELWHSKESNFEYGVGAIDIKKDIYSYTELVWYKTYMVGCAVAYCPQKTFPFLYVCHYCPAGNIVDEAPKPYKKGLPCGDCPNNCEDKLCTNPCKYKDTKKDCKQTLPLFKCDSKLMKKECEATCRCPTEII